MLGDVSPDARPGDLVHVYDKAGYPTGGGLYNPRAKIRFASSAIPGVRSMSPISRARCGAPWRSDGRFFGSMR